jgi:hypothetical protein
LIEACLRLQELRPDLDWSLTLVGNRYAGAFDIADYVERIASSNPRIQWLGIVDDENLERLYSESSFTVYPSTIEGFGMPIVESIWHGRPCLCANQGVMSELAAEGGCLTTDVGDTQALSDAVVRLVEDAGLRQRLSMEASRRRLKSWQDYVRDFDRILEGAQPRATPPSQVRTTLQQSRGAEPPAVRSDSWVPYLYPKQRVNNWQMHDSERLALTALLMRTRPTCAIEVGTYFGGSLSLFSEHAGLVYSIDIDPEAPRRAGPLPNVTYLTGRSATLLPTLLEELTSGGIPVNFVLIDGDHSEEGVRRDLSIVLQYVPREPMFLLAHDSFNPGCRRGMLEAPWQDSRYCHFVDLDFVPGRLIEHPGPSHGEPWGGLAMAFFHPTPRAGQVYMAQSASILFEAACASRHLNED